MKSRIFFGSIQVFCMDTTNQNLIPPANFMFPKVTQVNVQLKIIRGPMNILKTGNQIGMFTFQEGFHVFNRAIAPVFEPF